MGSICVNLHEFMYGCEFRTDEEVRNSFKPLFVMHPNFILYKNSVVESPHRNINLKS